mgnify:CR=1 FL=1
MSDKPTDKSSGIRQMKEALQGIDLAKMVTPPTLPNLNTEMPELEEFEAIPLREHIERTEDYQTHCLEILQSIEANTANLYTLVDLIMKFLARLTLLQSFVGSQSPKGEMIINTSFQSMNTLLFLRKTSLS